MPSADLRAERGQDKRKLEYSRQRFGAPETEKKVPYFVKFTKGTGRAFKGFGANAKFSPEQSDAFAFLGWDVTAEEFYATYKALFFLGMLVGAVIGGLLFLTLPIEDETIKLAIAGVCVLAPIGASYYYLKYPYKAVERKKMLALAYMPEIINYMTMSLRLTPNLEKAVEFAASHGQGKIADELKTIVWDVQIGRYLSIEEALDDLAYRWGNYNEDFKHALMLVRGSVLEANRTEREKMLEKASNDVIEGTREKMDLYARKLHQPTVYLYYFGILLPLLLAIILPIGGSMTGQQLAKPEYLFIAYNLAIPLLVYVYGSSILSGRPPTYAAPKIEKNFPGLPKPGAAKFFALLVFVAVVWLGYMTDQGVLQGWANSFVIPANNFAKRATNDRFSLPLVGEDGLIISGTLGQIPSYLSGEQRTEEIKKIPHFAFTYEKMGLFIGLFTIFGFLTGFCLAASIWLNAEYGARKKVQDEIRSMEGEFKDVLYVLASRLGENKPIEEALRSSVQFLPKSRLASDVFRRILENITTLGMTLDAAIFDKTFGALKNLPSCTIASGMRFLTDSVELGVNVAAKSLIALSIQLRNAQKIDEELRKLLEDVTVMLKTMATFVAPIVLAVVSAMQKMIINSIASSGATAAEAGTAQIQGVSGFQMANMFANPEIAKSSADPATFTAIMGIYVIEVVALLTYFNSQIEDPNNELHSWTSIANALPIATLLFCAAVYFAGGVIGATG